MKRVAWLLVAATACGPAELPRGAQHPPDEPSAVRAHLPFDADELQRLDDGEPIIRRFAFRHEGVDHIGALNAIWLPELPEEALEAITDLRSVCRWLPHNKRADVIGESGGTKLVRLRQGSSLFSTELTLRLTRNGSVVRFELDEDHPHDIEALRGLVIAGPLEYGSLLLFELTIALGSGLLRLARDSLWESFPRVIDDMRQYIQTATIIGYEGRTPCHPQQLDP